MFIFLYLEGMIILKLNKIMSIFEFKGVILWEKFK